MRILNILGLLALTSTLSIVAADAQITGRTVPSPIVGITYDDVSEVSAEVTTLISIAKNALTTAPKWLQRMLLWLQLHD